MAKVTRYYVGKQDGKWFDIMDGLYGRRVFAACGLESAKQIVNDWNAKLSD